MATNIKYKGNTIATIDTVGSKTLKTNGRYCEADIVVETTQDIDVAKAFQISNGMSRVNSTSYTATSATLNVEKSGTYTVKWFAYRSSTSGTNGTQLYIGNTAYGSAQTSFTQVSNTCQVITLTGVKLSAGQTITVRARSRNTSSYVYVSGLSIVEE